MTTLRDAEQYAGYASNCLADSFWYRCCWPWTGIRLLFRQKACVPTSSVWGQTHAGRRLDGSYIRVWPTCLERSGVGTKVLA